MNTLIDPKLPAQERNDAFQALTPEHKRVAVAQDALYQLSLGRLDVQVNDVYFRPVSPDSKVGLREKLDEWTEDAPVCTVCAIGAAFVGFVHLVNGSKMVYQTFSDIFIAMSSVFERKQLRLMECAFELNSLSCGICKPQDLEAALNFGSRYEDPTERLEAILQNIIANNGTFTP